MQERLNKLLSVKSLVTIALTIVFCVLAIRGIISGQEFLTIFTTVIAFYFGTQSAKAEQPAPATPTTGSDPGTPLPDTPDIIAEQNVSDATAQKNRPPDSTDVTAE